MPPRSHDRRTAPAARSLPRPTAVAVACRAGWRSALLFTAGALGAAGVQAQGLTVVPTLTLQQTLTDNVDLASGAAARSEAITQISPGVSVNSRTGRLQGSLNYSLNALFHTRESGRNTTQNALSAAFTAEAVPQHLFVDVGASITQQSISAFGAQGVPTGLSTANSTEVSSLSVAPTLRFSVGDLANATARVSWNRTSSASTSLGDSESSAASLNLVGRASGPLNWGATVTRQTSDFVAGRRTTQQTESLNLSYAPRPWLQFSARAGRETQDLVQAEDSNRTWGYGVQWRPTDRTVADVQIDRRFFGNARAVTLSHRMARTLFSYTDTRNVAGDDPAQRTLRPLTLFELLLSVCRREATEADAPRCEQAVREGLIAQGLDPNAVIGGGFLASGLTLQRSRNLSAAYSGLRGTLTLSAFSTESRRIEDGVPAPAGDLSRTDGIRQLGWTFGASRRLTSQSSLAVSTTRLKTLDTALLPGVDQRSTTVSWNTALGPRTSAALALRHSEFDSVSAPYQESAVIGSISLRF